MQLCEVLAHHAYAIRLAGISLKLESFSPQDLLKELDTEPLALNNPNEPNENLRALLKSSLDRLSEAAYEAFMAYGVLFSSSVSLELLALCTRRQLEESEEALFELQKRGLAERITNYGSDSIAYSLHDLARSFAKNKHHFRLSTIQQASKQFMQTHKRNFDLIDCDLANLLGAAQSAKQDKNDLLFNRTHAKPDS